MRPSALLTRFEAVLSTWENALDSYSESGFVRQPAPGAWSIGQVYIHLIGSAKRYHLRQIEACLSGDDHARAHKSFAGYLTYLLGGMLPVRIKVPPSPQYTPPQPESIEQVRNMIPALREQMAATAGLISQPHGKGKIAHPAFGFLNALEWFSLIGMHFRHHLRQKKRIDAFLRQQTNQ